MLFLLLSGAIFGACSSDKDRVPVFVKNVVMPPDSWVFAPGDGVTVSAEGFEADDEIMLEIHWQESAGGFAPEGYAKGVRGIVTVRSATSVTFLAPGHYPASTVRVLLLRRGRMMPLGKIRVADGTPKAEALYGISKSDTDETLIERIDLSTGGVTRVATLGIGRGIACAVGLPGSGWIYGVCSGSMAGFDLTMNYYDDFGYRNSLLAGHISDSSVGLISHDAGRLTLTTRSATRSPSPAPVSWQVPDEVVQTLAVQPFVRVGSDLLLAQRNADGTCAPLVLRVYGGAGPGEAVGADAMIPFWTVVARPTSRTGWFRRAAMPFRPGAKRSCGCSTPPVTALSARRWPKFRARRFRSRSMLPIRIRWKSTCCARRTACAASTSTMR